MSTLAATNLKHASSASNNIVLDSSGNTTISGAATISGALVPSSSFLRNRIINGDMRIDQRNAGAATANTINGYTLDRWAVNQSVTGKLIAQQSSSVAPVGFSNSLSITSQSSYSVLTGDYYVISQYIEGFNFADMMWGTANARSVTLSFQVYSSLTGTFGGSLRNSATNRSYPFSYTISASNTWTSISIIIAGDTSGTWVGATNGIGVNVNFGLGVGSTFSGTSGAWAGSNLLSATGATSVVGTNGATFYLTGVQLEVGTAATPFERRQYGQELALCQRYYEKSYSQATTPGTATSVGRRGGFSSSTNLSWYVTNIFVATKRAAPTVTIYSTAVGTAGNVTQDDGSNVAGTVQHVSDASFEVTWTNGAGRFAGNYHFAATAEL